MLFLTPENTFICEGFEWTSRRLGDLKLTFMELLGYIILKIYFILYLKVGSFYFKIFIICRLTIDENVEDESQISYNALYPYDVKPAFPSGDMGNGLARVIFENVPNMPDLTKLERFLLKAETSNPSPKLTHNSSSIRNNGNLFVENNSSNHDKNKRSWLYEEIDCDLDMGFDVDFELPPLKRFKCGTNDEEKKLDGENITDFELPPLKMFKCDTNDEEKKLDGGSIADFELPPLKKFKCGTNEEEMKLDGGSITNPIVLDYDDNDYEMDLGCQIIEFILFLYNFVSL